MLSNFFVTVGIENTEVLPRNFQSEFLGRFATVTPSYCLQLICSLRFLYFSIIIHYRKKNCIFPAFLSTRGKGIRFSKNNFTVWIKLDTLWITITGHKKWWGSKLSSLDSFGMRKINNNGTFEQKNWGFLKTSAAEFLLILPKVC